MSRRRCALVLTHNRQELLVESLRELRPQVEDIVVIDNASDPPTVIPNEWRPAAHPTDGAQVRLFWESEQPPNLAKMWNRGLSFFLNEYRKDFDVAVLCDDAVVPPGWFDAVTAGMRATNAVIGCSNPWGTYHEPRVKISPDRDIGGRMPGWAWIMNGDFMLRADESMHWWWLDTDIDFQAREAGGMVMVGGFPVLNVHPGEFTVTKPELGARAGQDQAVFEAKWGFRPW